MLFRSPLLDHKLVEYVLGLGEAAKAFADNPKPLLTAALKDLLPAPVVHRPKQGFAMPFDRWLRGPLRDLAEASLDTVADQSAFRPEATRHIWRTFLDDHPSTSASRIVLLVSLGRWLEGIDRLESR